MEFEPGRRILVVSDVHGKLSWLTALLEQVAFGPEDYLVLLGDLVERGEASLAVLRYGMELCRSDNVFFVTGNCDTLALDLQTGSRGVAGWLRHHPESHMLQLAREGGFAYRGEEDAPALGKFLFSRYPAELAFLTGSPTILETERFVFVHGGVPSMAHMETLEAYTCMKNDAFLDQGRTFPKYCVVGHWPTTLYRADIPCCNPIFQRERKILSIDGGCGVKVGGQLNALVIPYAGSEDFSWVSYDDYPAATALEPQAERAATFNIRWGENQVDILARGPEFSLCRHRATGREVSLLTRYLRTWNGADCCEDSTDYRLEVAAGECLSVVEETSRGRLVKKNGVLGWYLGRVAAAAPKKPSKNTLTT